MGGKHRKVAYVVFKGREPGVYKTYDEVLRQVNGFSGCLHRGFTAADGGWDAANRAFQEHVKKEERSEQRKQGLLGRQVLGKHGRGGGSWGVEKDTGCEVRRVGDGGEDRRAALNDPHSVHHRSGGSKLPLISKCSKSSAEEKKSDVRKALADESNTVKNEDPPGDSTGETMSFSGMKEYKNLPSSNQDKVEKDNRCIREMFEMGSRHERSGISMQAPEARERSPVSRGSCLEGASPISTDYGNFPSDPPGLDIPQFHTVEKQSFPWNRSENSYEYQIEDLKLRSPVPSQTSEPGPELCDEQRNLVNLILSGHNVFYTGSAGCGKSTVLKALVRELRIRNCRFDIVAPTGRAALEAGGVTLHAYAGWIPASMAKPIDLLNKKAHEKRNWQRFNRTQILIIDEVSMLENHVFERLNSVMKSARGSEKPFGGVQIVVTGDFCQLPPVKPFKHCIGCGKELLKIPSFRKNECTSADCEYEHIIFYDSHMWAFCSGAWQECGFKYVNLQQIHRQKDLFFIRLLEKCRIGKTLTQDEKNFLQKPTLKKRGYDISKTQKEAAGEKNNTEFALKAIRLFPKKDDVKSENDKQLASIEHECYEFNCIDDFHWNPKHEGLEGLCEPGNPKHTLKILDEHYFEATLEIKLGMPVILLINLDFTAGLINGSQGILIGYEDHNPNKFPETLGAHGGRRRRYIEKFVREAHHKRWPVIRFPGSNNLERTIYPHCMMNELGDGGIHHDEYSLLSRTQIPLLAAWAISIHKSQGMTLTEVEVNLAKAWAQSVRYVALSRAKEPERLTLTGGWGHGNQGLDTQVRAFLEEHGLLDMDFLCNGRQRVEHT